MHHFQGEFGGKDHHLFGELERCLHWFWYQSLIPFYICMLFMFIISQHVLFYSSLCLCHVYQISDTHVQLLETPMFYMNLYLSVLTLFLTNMYALDLMHMHIHNDHMDIYDFCFDQYVKFLVYQTFDMHVQLLRSPLFNMDHLFLCSHLCLAIMYFITLIACGFT